MAFHADSTELDNKEILTWEGFGSATRELAQQIVDSEFVPDIIIAVARGGLRASDRDQDFRAEVLDLMRAQVLKNAVIVPTGAKGGFYPKQLPRTTDREAIQGEAIRAYRTFLSGLLDITDNIGADGGVVRPANVIAWEGDDPYLVVAADKGTATFSDIANGVGAVLEPAEWRFLNTDLVTHLHRPPVGRWIGVAARASIGPDGVGATSGTLFDEKGAIGDTLQALRAHRPVDPLATLGEAKVARVHAVLGHGDIALAGPLVVLGVGLHRGLLARLGRAGGRSVGADRVGGVRHG